jgi:hypothetical protein
MRRSSIIACALALIVGTVHGEPQHSEVHPAHSIVGDWVRVKDKPEAVTHYRADGKWSIHVVGLRGLTFDGSGTYTLKGNVLKRKTLKTVSSKKRLYIRRTPYQSLFQMKWLSRDRITLTTNTLERFQDTWVRLHPRSSN